MTDIRRKISKGFRIAVLVCASAVLSTGAAQAVVGPAVKVSAKYVDDVLEAAAKLSGKTLTPTGRQIALNQLRNAALKHGDDAIVAARNGGLELMEVAAKHGDDVWTFAGKVPAGARALAMRPQELLPMTRRIGTDVLELEAKAPGLSGHVVRNFGDDGLRYFARQVPVDDASRLLGYAEKADSPATRQMLLEAYQKGGTHFLDRLNWKQIIAGGLSVAAITAAYQVSDGVQEGLMTVSENSPETFHKTASHAIDRLSAPIVIPATLFGVGLASIWLLRYWIRTRRKAGRGSDPVPDGK